LAKQLGVSWGYSKKIRAQQSKTGQKERPSQTRHGPGSRLTPAVEQPLRSALRQPPDLTLSWKSNRELSGTSRRPDLYSSFGHSEKFEDLSSSKPEESFSSTRLQRNSRERPANRAAAGYFSDNNDLMADQKVIRTIGYMLFSANDLVFQPTLRHRLASRLRTAVPNFGTVLDYE